MQINLVYEIKEGKYITWNLNNWKISWKKYYFSKLSNLDMSWELDLYMQDEKFDFQSKNFKYNSDKKISIKQIEKNLNSFDFWKNIFAWYIVNNIYENGEKSKFILGKSGNVSYNVWIYTIRQRYHDRALKNFGKNKKINIYPNSIHMVQKIWEDIQDWTIMYILKNKIKIINIEEWFYKNVEEVDIKIKDFKDNILEIFAEELKSLADMTDFNKKVYMRELDKFLEPVKIFVNNACKSNKIYVIWNFEKTPSLLENLGKSTGKLIAPIKVWTKRFSSIEEADIFYIKSIWSSF